MPALARLTLCACLALLPRPAFAREPAPSEHGSVTDYAALQRALVQEPLLPALRDNEPDQLRLTASGLVLLRAQLHSDYALPTLASLGDARAPHGQRALVLPWLRFTPMWQHGRNFRVVLQLDALQGKPLGDDLDDVTQDAQPRAHSATLGSYLQLRHLYAEYKSPMGVWRLGMQPHHWAMGLIAHDGQQPLRFGLPRLGQIVERLQWEGAPLGASAPLRTSLAADWIYRDPLAELTRGDVALAAVFTATLRAGMHQVGLLTSYRAQSSHAGELARLKLFTFDLAAHTAAQLPGRDDAWLFAEAEAALQLGSARTRHEELGALEHTSVRGYGTSARVGLVFSAQRTPAQRAAHNGELAPQPRSFGRVVAELAWSYTSGDSDPHDGVSTRFVADPNHRAGLLLFDEVLRWSSARAAAIARDARLPAAERPRSALSSMPTHGSALSAQYINPSVTFRPLPRTSVRAGALLAQATADLRSTARRSAAVAQRNEWRGDAAARDLGLELDLALEHRASLGNGFEASFGVEAGVLLPGAALRDAAGQRLRTPWLGAAQLSLRF